MRRGLALRGWLLVAVGVLATLPVAAGAGAWFGVTGWQKARERSRLDAAVAIVERGRGRWSDRAWQAEAERRLADIGVDVQLDVKPTGNGTDQAGMAKLKRAAVLGGPLSTAIAKVAVPAGPAFATPGLRAPAQADDKARGDPRTTTVVLAPAPGYPAAGLGVYVRPASPAVRIAATLGAGLTVLVAALVAISLALRRFVVAPLAGLADGAERIAGGDLDVAAPRSPVREIDQVAAAMHGMSGSLRRSVARDARAEHERRFLVSAVAHDLRTPLFTLRGYLEGMDHGLDDGSYVGRAREKADLLDRLVSDLFAYSRWELLDEPPRREPVELGELARRAAGTVAERAHGRAVAIEPGGPPLTVVADGHLLTRVLANLLDNAVRHSPPDTTVQVRWQRRDGVAVIEVADHGPGLDPSEIPRLFEPLYRGDAARNSRTGGAGLGLAIARRLVDAHGGTVTAANRPGGGACFTVTLPLEGAGSGALVGPHRGAVGADLGPGRAQL